MCEKKMLKKRDKNSLHLQKLVVELQTRNASGVTIKHFESVKLDNMPNLKKQRLTVRMAGFKV